MEVIRKVIKCEREDMLNKRNFHNCCPEPFQSNYFAYKHSYEKLLTFKTHDTEKQKSTTEMKCLVT